MKKVLSQEDLQQLKEVASAHDNVINELGNITVQINEFETKLEELRAERTNYLSSYTKIREKSIEINSLLSSKYGVGQVDLNTGEIS
jgi:flagellar biosynthesis chaperone FliJ